ncbi:hypothetical protein E2C01_052373 [Portunus trituberculatus]|uniref:Uncharacterized protein n=1 Tax=Portunus trituberculatus TaxID=210409 RepID=A0A5B7GEE4_PORTR|nr:hypothetical protein [Portunus trituberculatus]
METRPAEETDSIYRLYGTPLNLNKKPTHSPCATLFPPPPNLSHCLKRHPIQSASHPLASLPAATSFPPQGPLDSSPSPCFVALKFQ